MSPAPRNAGSPRGQLSVVLPVCAPGAPPVTRSGTAPQGLAESGGPQLHTASGAHSAPAGAAGTPPTPLRRERGLLAGALPAA